MEIEFAARRLAAASTSQSEAVRLLGVSIGQKYIQRLNVIRATDTFSQLFGHRALRLHPLKGDRSGQFALMLTGNHRLILERLEEDRVRIVDVEDYHGD